MPHAFPSALNTPAVSEARAENGGLELTTRLLLFLHRPYKPLSAWQF